MFIMNYSLFPHSPLLNVHHTCKCIMHFSLCSLTRILWSPVNNQPGKGFAVLTHRIHCSFVPVYCAHCPRSVENWNAWFFSPYFWSTRSKGFPSNQKDPKPSPSVWIVSQSLNNTCFVHKKSNNNFCEMEQGFALHPRTLTHMERIGRCILLLPFA